MPEYLVKCPSCTFINNRVIIHPLKGSVVAPGRCDKCKNELDIIMLENRTDDHERLIDFSDEMSKLSDKLSELHKRFATVLKE